MLTPSRRIAGIKSRAKKAEAARAVEVIRAAGYVRVSTEEQVSNGLGLESQERAVKAFAESQGYKLAGIIADKGVSGATPPFERPGFSRLVEMAEAKEFSVLLVSKFDRLARNIIYSVTAVKDLDDRYGVAVRSVSEPIDSSTPMGRTIFAIFAGMAEQERETITDRMHGGRKEKALKGGFAGGEAPYGYRKDERKGLVIDERQADVVRRIFSMRKEQGLRLQDIADRLNADGVKTKRGGRWWPSQVQYILENRKYVGAVEYLFQRNGEVLALKKGKHKAIITA